MKRAARRALGTRRRTFGLILCVAVLVPGQRLTAACAPAAAYHAAQSHPNVVVLMLDDADVADIMFMPKVQAELVSKGVSFTRAYAPNPLCCPSRASLLTGKYSHNHHVLTNSPPDGGFFEFNDHRTLATWLDGAFTTGWIGKYLNDYELGSDEFVPPGWDVWKVPVDSVYNYRDRPLNINGQVRWFDGLDSSRLYGRLTRSFIRRHAGETQPFLLITSFLAPHSGTPHEPGDPSGLGTPFVDPRYRGSYSGPSPLSNPAFNEASVRDKPRTVRHNRPLTRRQIRNLVKENEQRRESLLTVDDQIGRILDTLNALDEMSDTVVVLVSDNGLMLGEHRIYKGKSVPYNPATQIPLILRGPGLPPGTSVDVAAGIPDLAPTILDLTNFEGAQGQFRFDGVSLVNAAKGAQTAVRPIVLETGNNRGGYTFRGIVRGRWKYIEYPAGRVELYNELRDPWELHSLTRVPRYAYRVSVLHALLMRYQSCRGERCH
jgi:N-acetylglucosamine-6-sulfatase